MRPGEFACAGRRPWASMTRMATDEQTATWREWLDLFGPQIITMKAERELFREMRDTIVAVAPDAPATWLLHYARLYWQSQTMSVRRIVKGENKGPSASLTRLMVEVARDPQAPGSDTMDAKRAALLKSVQAVLDRADRAVAHLDTVNVRSEMTFADLHSAIDTVHDAFNDLAILLTARDWVYVSPFGGDWRAPFRRALFPPAP